MSTIAKPRRRATESGRDSLVRAAKDLFSRFGYESTSPRQIYDASGTGQGSLYHHFDGKLHLAGTVLSEVADEELAFLEHVTRAQRDPLARIEAYLKTPRNGTLGCKMGRYAYEIAIEHDEIQMPVRKYFTVLELFLTDAIAAAQQAGQLRQTLEPGQFASLLIDSIQGGYIRSRAFGTGEKLRASIAAASALLDLCKTGQ